MFVKDIIQEYSVRNRENHAYPVYSVTNSQGFCKDYFGKEVASKDKSTYKIVPYGYFAYNPSRINVGSIDWQHCEDYVIVSPLYNVFKVNTNLVSQDYLSYYFKSSLVSTYINALAKGTVRLNIPLSVLGNFPIPVPSIAEQERIVAELDLLQGIIEKKKEQLKAYDQLAQSIFYTMFGDPIDNPKGWETKKLEEVGTIVAGSTPSTNDESNWDGDINWVTPAELSEQLYYGETARKLTEKGAKGLTLMPVGTVLLSSRAPIGKLAITTSPMCCNQGFKNIICDNIINNVFLYYYLKNTMDLIQALGRGATFKEVSKSAISSYKVFLPPLSLQEEFAEKVEAIERQKALVQQSIEETQTMFDYTMDKYFG